MTAVTTKQFLAVTQEMAAALERITKQAGEKIAALEKRVAELEAAPAMVASHYREGDRYLANAYCERNGALYRCVRPTREKPGESAHWVAVSSVRIHLPVPA